jgi:uncharacterized membrane protein
MSTKRSVSTIREELRVLNAAADEIDNKTTTEWLTPEFWSMVSAAATNLIAVGVLVGWVSGTTATELTQALTALIGATEVLLLNSLLVWKYISGRTALKVQAMASRTRYMETLAIERMRIG